MAFDRTYFTATQANLRAFSSLSVGFFIVGTSHRASNNFLSSSLINISSPMDLKTRLSFGKSFHLSNLKFFFFFKISKAGFSKPGAQITSINFLDKNSAIFASNALFTAIMPPNAERGSELQALSKASIMFAPLPMPQGVTCLNTTAAGSSNSITVCQVP